MTRNLELVMEALGHDPHTGFRHLSGDVVLVEFGKGGTAALLSLTATGKVLEEAVALKLKDTAESIRNALRAFREGRALIGESKDDDLKGD